MDKYNFSIAKYGTHNIIINNIGKNNTILDVGCNKGYIGLNSDKSNTFYGLEYDINALEEAKKIYKDVTQYDLNNLVNLNFEVDKFDIIVFADVLEHVLFPNKVLKFFKKYLKDDGKIIVSLPNVANWQIRLNLLFGKFDYTETGIMDKTHLHFYTLRSTKELLSKSGYKIEKIYYGASFFGIIINFFPFLGKLLSTNIIITAKK